MGLIRFSLIAPDRDNAGRPAPDHGSPLFRDYARRIILAGFDGATAVRGFGHWRDGGRDYDEPVTVWSIDADESEAYNVVSAARMIARYADQIAVYVASIGAHGFSRVFVAQDSDTDQLARELVPSTERIAA